MTESRKCSHPGCKAWAMHGKDYCSAHRPGGIPGGGAPRGNTNALKHGLYARKLAQRIQEYVDLPDDQTIDTELALLRTVNKYIATCLQGLMASAERQNYQLVIRLSQALCRSTQQIIRVLKARQETSPDFDAFLDELNEVAGWEMKL
jgi:uncharacterized protein YjcR